jgi:Raf kinase inhibitor-like YbhB/YbcL family protein
MTLKLSSSAFAHRGQIPDQYTCDGASTPPPLQWSNVPAGAKSLALIVDDPDAPDPKAPTHTFVHWVVYNLPPSATSLGEGRQLPAGAREGANDSKKIGYIGPCPPRLGIDGDRAVVRRGARRSSVGAFPTIQSGKA